MDLAELVYRVTAQFPVEERYGLTSQMRRSAASIPANIAEGQGRETSGAFVQFLRVAQGSLKELETHSLLSERLGYLAGTDAKLTLTQCGEVGRILRALIRAVQRKDNS